MSEDSVRAERDDDRRILHIEDSSNRRYELFEGKVCEATVGKT